MNMWAPIGKAKGGGLSGLAKSIFCPDTQFNGVFDDFKKIGARD